MSRLRWRRHQVQNWNSAVYDGGRSWFTNLAPGVVMRWTILLGVLVVAQAPVRLAVNRLPARSYALTPTRKIYVCGGSGFGKNVCRSVKQLPLRYQ